MKLDYFDFLQVNDKRKKTIESHNVPDIENPQKDHSTPETDNLSLEAVISDKDTEKSEKSEHKKADEDSEKIKKIDLTKDDSQRFGPKTSNDDLLEKVCYFYVDISNIINN